MNGAHIGQRVRTRDQLGTTEGMLAHPAYIQNRRPGALGTVSQIVPGHGGEVWVVTHEDNVKAVYSIDEMDEA